MNNEIKYVSPFKKLCITVGNLPTAYIESMSYYEGLTFLVNYISNNVIPALNNNGEAVEELQNKFVELKNFTENYFANLDIQEEINNKLDAMVLDGSLGELLQPYVKTYVDSAMDNTIIPTLTSFSEKLDNQDLSISEQNTEISTFKTSVNNQISQQNILIQSATSGTPLVASDVSGMTDTDKVYVNTTDGNWYYYDGDSWKIGGVYLASSESDNINNLNDTVYSSFESGVESNILTRTNGNNETITNTGISSATTQITGSPNSQAYTNDYEFTKNAYITGIKLNDNTTTTSFDIYVSKNNEIIKSYVGLTPSIDNHIATLDEPIYVEKDYKIYIRHNNGSYYMYRAGTNDYYEYRPGTTQFIATPYKAGFDIVYNNINYKFHNGEYKLSDFKTPKLEINKPDNYNYWSGTADNSVTLIGRWFDKTINGVTKKCCNADGSSLIFKVSGLNVVYVILKAITTPTKTPYYAYSIDGGAFTRTKITNTGIVLPDTEEHIVWVVIDGMGENDPVGGGKWTGSVGIYLDAWSANCQALNPKNRNILFIGDSITEGINVLGSGADADVNSAINSFAFKTARKLNSIPLMCGYGGTSILGNASFHKAIEALQYNMDNVPVNEQKPDIVVINHGYNDYNLIYTLHQYSQQEFIDGYKALIEKINIMYPGISIICVEPFAGVMLNDIESAIEDYSNCYLINTTEYNPSTTDGVHLDQAGAEKVSTLLSKDIELIMNKSYFMN